MERKRKSTDCSRCESQTVGRFKKGEVILSIGDHSGRVGVILEGRAHIATLDAEGRDSILEFLMIGDSFGEHLMMSVGSQVCNVLADTDCTVMFISYDNVIRDCKDGCQNHTELVKMLLLLTATKVQTLSLHVNILSQRTLRKKLMTYLEYQSKGQTGEDSPFRIPMTLVNLADYLGVDRSAMMREIHNMNRDGLIKSRGRTFCLMGQ